MEGLAAEVPVAGVRLKPETVFSSLPSQGRGEEDVKILAKREASRGGLAEVHASDGEMYC